MAYIQWTSYRFFKPPLPNESEYILIKETQKTNPSYKPYSVESFFSKFKIGLLGYLVGGPLAILIYSIGESLSYGDFLIIEYLGYLLMILSGFYLFVLFGGLFNAIPTSISYIKYLINHKLYYNILLKNIRISNDYDHFLGLMNKRTNHYLVILGILVIIACIIYLLN